MIDHSNKIVGTMMYDRVATWPEICKHKPELTQVVECSPGLRRRIKLGKSHRHYWWGQCISCKQHQLIRADRVDMYRCKCHKPGEVRTCCACHKTLPKSASFWYITKTGRFDSHCKPCRKAYAANRYQAKRPEKMLHYDRDMNGGNDA